MKESRIKNCATSRRSEAAKMAKIIFEALRRANPEALMWGEPSAFDQHIRDADVLIDGTFNFRVVARFVRQALEKLDPCWKHPS